MDISQLRTTCNQNGISCRDHNGALVNQATLFKRIQGQQTGGAMSAVKAWDKYRDALSDRLSKDRTYKGSTGSLPSAFTMEHPKHLEWMITSYLAKGIRYYEDVASRVYPALDNHAILLRNKKLSKGIRTEPCTNETNVLNYCGLMGCQSKRKGKPFQKPGLDQLLDKYKADLEVLSVPKYKPDPKTQCFDGKDIKIYKLKTQEEACYYGQGTKWCTAASKNNMFDYYNQDDDLYVIIPKKASYEGEKYQLAIDRTSNRINDTMNEQDSPVKKMDLLTLYPEIQQISAVAQYALYGGNLSRQYDLPEGKYNMYDDKNEAVEDGGIGDDDDDDTIDMTIVRFQDEIPTDIGNLVCDYETTELTMRQGTIEALIPSLIELFQNPPADTPCGLAKIIYPYAPEKLLSSISTPLTRGLGRDDTLAIKKEKTLAIWDLVARPMDPRLVPWYDTETVEQLTHLLVHAPAIRADAIQNHYDQVLFILAAMLEMQKKMHNVYFKDQKLELHENMHTIYAALTLNERAIPPNIKHLVEGEMPGWS
jgi:hypothetical protein